MAAPINIDAYSDALVVLGTAGIIVPLVQRFGLSPVLGYLGAGAVLGPLGLGSFVADVPLLYWLTVVDAKNVAGIADLGVVFLLFLIGLELSYERLKAVRRLVLGLGGLQILISTAIIALALAAAGLKAPIAILLGALLALSSTAIVLEVLSRQGRLATSTGRASFAVLLAQDLAVVPVLMFVSILGGNKTGSIAANIGLALLEAGAAIAIIALIGRFVLRPLLRLVAGTGSKELFIAAILFVIVATAVVAALADLSMALGAFVAGLMLAETEYRKAIEAAIEPYKGLLLGIFFFTVGMGIDARELGREPALLLAAVVGLVAVKAAVLILLGRLFRLSWPTAAETGLLLGPGGEFAFVGLGLALSLGLVTPRETSFTIAVTSLSMALIPLLAIAARRWSHRLAPVQPVAAELEAKPEPQQRHAIVVGYGRVGKLVSTMLARHNVAYTAIDDDPALITHERRMGHPVYFGDAVDPAFLAACGLEKASSMIVTIHARGLIDEIVREVRRIRTDIPIVCRARDAEHARHLYAIGVTDAVPETIEASLQLSEAALVGMGIPTGPVIASIHEQRDVFRRELQDAASGAGRTARHSLRQKARRASSQDTG
jgi:CPA2 family monovalent cation:H+ antiporter-2